MPSWPCLISSQEARLQALHLVERRLPVTVPPARRSRSRQGRYHLSDPYFRFYFRFIAPHRDDLAYEPERALPLIRKGLRAFVGETAFEELCRQWIAEQGRAGGLCFEPQEVGSHWSRRVQVDVVAVNWRERAIMLGECKWGAKPVGRQVVRELLEEKSPRLLQDLPDAGEGWKVGHALFARAGSAGVARSLAQAHDALLVDLDRLDRDLAGV